MSELKPCPFCGGEADYGYDSSMILVECTDCYAATAMYMSQDIAAKKWNSRTTDSDLTTVTNQRDIAISVAEEILDNESIPDWEQYERKPSTINEQKGSN